MIIKGENVTFEQCDMNYVTKLGFINAAETALEFTSKYNLPFIRDTDQLAGFFSTASGGVFHTVRNCDKMYTAVSIPKKSGGHRELQVPNTELKYYQRRILHGILDFLPVSRYATAYRNGATLAYNASPHIGHKYLLKLDITDFFGSITFMQVYSAAFNAKYFPKQIGAMLATLCCFEDVLPQGAPTSPALSNIVMKNFDDSFGAWCKEKGFEYTRYCDDITVSGNEKLYPAFRKAKNRLEAMGFEINEKKTHFITNANRQSVTGITVNEKLSISKDYKRKLRQEIYYALRFGVENVIRHNYLTDYITGGIVDFEGYVHHLIGKINYVLSIEKSNSWFRDAKYKLQNETRCYAIQQRLERFYS